MAERMLATTVAALLAAWTAAPAGLVVEWWGDGARCRHQGMTIELSKYGKEGMVNPKKGKVPIEGIHALRFDLSALKAGT
ncbi:MAG: hypothetical protein B1H04_02945, partial [Planctomycetales bacterium 4484_123]